MTVKPTVSLTDQTYSFARSLVDSGRFASLSAVVQHGLTLIERDEQEYQARLEAIRTDLDRRSQEPAISTEEMDALLEDWWAERDGKVA
jgi:antitoxin ParD1/3/4